MIKPQIATQFLPEERGADWIRLTVVVSDVILITLFLVKFLKQIDHLIIPRLLCWSSGSWCCCLPYPTSFCIPTFACWLSWLPRLTSFWSWYSYYTFFQAIFFEAYFLPSASGSLEFCGVTFLQLANLLQQKNSWLSWIRDQLLPVRTCIESGFELSFKDLAFFANEKLSRIIHFLRLNLWESFADLMDYLGLACLCKKILKSVGF